MQHTEQEIKIKLPETIKAKGYAGYHSTDKLAPFSFERRKPGAKDGN